MIRCCFNDPIQGLVPILVFKGSPTSLDILLYFFVWAVDYENRNQSFVSRFWLANESSKVSAILKMVAIILIQARHVIDDVISWSVAE